jgi:alpha-ribazole phosphatase
MADLWCWRHPRAQSAQGRCSGRTDLALDPRRAKRLAHQIRRTARQQGLPRVVWTSPLKRCQAVGRWLRRWGWRLHVDPALLEVDFGQWDGLLWSQIDAAAIGAWADDLLHHAPGGGESLHQLATRARAFAQARGQDPQPCLLVGHGGWINALLHVPADAVVMPASEWPAPPGHGQLQRWQAAGSPVGQSG